MTAKKIWAVIPAYNEEKNIKNIVSKTKKYVDEVVVVDDGSRDNTKKISRKSRRCGAEAHVINLGKGAPENRMRLRSIKKGQNVS